MLTLAQHFSVRGFRLVLHATGLTMALLIVSLALVAYAALEKQRSHLQSEQDNAEELLRDKFKVFHRHDEAKRKLKELDAAVTQLRAMFPATPDETGLLASLSRLAEQTDIELHNFHAGTIRSFPTHKIIEVSFRADGMYAGVCRFLATLKSLPRRVYISQLNIVAPTTVGQCYTIDVQLQLAFALVEPPERK